MKQGRLPEDFPSRAALAAADINTFAQVRNLKGDYSEIAGVGPARAAEIDAALLAVENDVDEAETAEVTLDVAAPVEPVRPALVPETPVATPDLDLEDLKSRAAHAKPRNEALCKEIADKLGMAQQRITEAVEMLDKLIHVELS